MSSSVDVQRRPTIWSYLSFGSSSNPTSNTRRRTSSVSLPLRNDNTHDPFEKPDRHNHSNGHVPGLMEKFNAMNQGKRTRYIKAGGILAFIFFLFYLLSPGKYVADHVRGGDVASDPSVATSKCTKSYSPSKPLIQYALMIDAGSTGSRIHVFRYNNCGPTPELEEEIFEQTPKKKGGSGLSAYGDDPDAAAKSLDVLLKVAVDKVPEKLKRCSPIAVKATAGLRKLGEEKSKLILDAVRHRLETEYPFPVVEEAKGGVEVMDGKHEAVYAWITANYLLGKIGGPDKSPTAAVFDLGGGSTQIVFEPTFPMKGGGMPEKLAEGDHKYELSFGGREFTLYQHSYLGYGLMAARDALHKVVIEGMHKQNPDSTAWLNKPIHNPCINAGVTTEIKVPLGSNHPLGKEVTVNMTGPAEGSPAQCRAIAEMTLQKEAECKIAPCAFNGVHQPPLAKVFATEDLYLLSFFYDRMRPLGMPDSFTLREMQDLTHKVCNGPKHWAVFESFEEAMDELNGRAEYCLDLSFMLALLHTGYEMPIDREVKIAKTMKGNELGWALGASLPLLEQTSGWKCRIKEVA